jgi:lipid-A-disaccharide synthase-like uncharacterized protein
MFGYDIDPKLLEKLWAGIGLVGQGVFTARFAVQWLASERKRETVMPVAFWWLSLVGGFITLTYAIHLESLSFTLGQSMGLFVYVRNLMLISRNQRRAARREARAQAEPSGEGSAIPRPHRRESEVATDAGSAVVASEAKE